MLRDDEIAMRLLRHLSDRWSRRDLAYLEPPLPLSGGFDTAIFAFALEHAPDEFGGRLILRLGREDVRPARFALEAATQNALAGMGYPAPRVLVAETDAGVIGGPFLIMQRLAGKPLVQNLEGLDAGASTARKLKALVQLPATFKRITRAWVDMQVRLHRQPVKPLMAAAAAAGLDERHLTFDGQLARLAASIERARLAGLAPGLSWLKANRPDDRVSAAICHGDFHPLNIMSDGGKVTGVIDWANVVIAAPEMDVGSAVANIAALPIKMPRAMRPLLTVLVGTLLRRYVAAYRQSRPLSEASLRYYQVYRAMAQLSPAASNVLAGRIGGGAFHSDAGIRNLIAHIRAQGGPSLRL